MLRSHTALFTLLRSENTLCTLLRLALEVEQKCRDAEVACCTVHAAEVRNYTLHTAEAGPGGGAEAQGC